MIKALIDQLKLNVRLVNVRDHAEGMLALETGRIDVYVHDEVGQYALLCQVDADATASKWSVACCRSIPTG